MSKRKESSPPTACRTSSSHFTFRSSGDSGVQSSLGATSSSANREYAAYGDIRIALNWFMERTNVRIQAIPLTPQPIEIRIAGGHSRSGQFEASSQFLDDLLLVGCMTVALQNEVSQSFAIETPLHDIEGRHFLADEQHRLAVGQALRDQVGNCLALTGSGRTIEDQADPFFAA